MRRNLKYDEFEKRISEKRQKTEKKSHIVPRDIMVQRMSAVPSGRLKKYEPLDTRDFVSFKGFTELSIRELRRRKQGNANHRRNARRSRSSIWGFRG